MITKESITPDKAKKLMEECNADNYIKQFDEAIETSLNTLSPVILVVAGLIYIKGVWG